MSARPPYPHVIKARTRDIAGHVGLCLIVVAMAVWLIPVITLSEGDVPTRAGLMALMLSVGGFAAWEGINIATSRTIFEADSVTVKAAWIHRRFERAKLFGWRVGGERAGLRLVELYSEAGKRPFSIAIAKTPDDIVAAWFEGARDLAFDDRKNALKDVEADEDFGHTKEVRIENVDAEGRFLRYVGFGVLALVAWVVLFPRPYHYAVGAAIMVPILVLFATFIRRDRWKLDRGETDFRPATGPLIVLCGVALLLRAIYDWRLINWDYALLLSAGFAVMATILVALVFNERDRTRLLGWLAVAMMYGFGALVPLNMWLDPASPTVHRASVSEIWESRFRLASSSPLPRDVESDASRDFLQRLSADGEACLLHYRGAFGVSSYDIELCDD